MTTADRISNAVARLRTNPQRQRLLACCLVGLALAWVLAVFSSVARRPSIDQHSLQLAFRMLGVSSGQVGVAPVDAGRAPGYPMALWALGSVFPGVGASLACHDGAGGCAEASLAAVLAAQLLLALTCVAMALRMFWRLSGSVPVAIAATLLAVFSTHLGELAGMVRPHMVYVTLSLLGGWLLVETLATRRLLLVAGAGAAFAGAALLEPVVVLLVPLVAVLLGVIWPSEEPLRRRLAASAVFTGAACMVHVSLYRFAVAIGYGADGTLHQVGVMLAQRMGFLGLDRSTWLAAVVTPVPLLGESASWLLPLAEVRRLAIGAVPGSIAAEGVSVWQATATKTGASAVLALIDVASEALRRPVAYLASTVPLLMRGLFAGGGLVALLGLFHLRRMLAYARADDRLGTHLMLLLPPLGLLLLNALFTSNAWWLNPLLPFVYAYAVAYVAQGW